MTSSDVCMNIRTATVLGFTKRYKINYYGL